ncbi:hypothetical protein [Nibricoccus sp. IMCC34717]|uniref:hypothetical protein n=1 Tax=Nibricoccus sp. IMCC34717 TaxID=3034021 RepID=UPI0038505D0E
MALEPAPELLSLPDPYDSSVNGRWRMGDASLYQGKYHLYFGVVPAVTLIWPWEAITGLPMHIGYAIQVFCSLGFLGLFALFVSVRARCFPQLSLWWLVPLVLIAAACTRVTGLLTRTMFWELPSASAFAWSMALLHALWRASYSERPLRWLALAGLCFGMVVGSRPNLVLTLPVFIPVAIWLLRRGRAKLIPLVVAVALGMGPPAVGLAGFNYARFGKIQEFGQSYQLVGMREIEGRRFALDYVPINLWCYFAMPPKLEPEFPYIKQVTRQPANRHYFPGESLCGYFWVFPAGLLMFALPLLWRKRGADLRARDVLDGLQEESTAGAVDFRPVLYSVFTYTGLAMGSMLLFFSGLSRYFMDFAPGLALLTGFGVLVFGAAFTKGWRRSAAFVGVLLLSVLSVIGAILLRFDCYDRYLEVENPNAFAEASASVESWVGRLSGLGIASAPSRIEVRGGSLPSKSTVALASAGKGYGRLEAFVEIQARGQAVLQYRHLDRVFSSAPFALPTAEIWSFELLGFPSARTFSNRPTGPILLAVNGRVEALIPANLPQELLRSLQTASAPAPSWQSVDPAALEDRGEWFRMRFYLPKLKAGRWPIFACGVPGSADLVYIERLSDGQFILALDHWGAPLQRSAPFSIAGDEPQVLEVHLPSFAAGKWGQAASGPVEIRLNGRAVLKVEQWAGAFTPDQIYVGRNPIGFMTCTSLFPGRIFEAVWRGEK